MLDERDINRDLKKPRGGGSNALDVLYMVQRQNGFDIGKCSVVVDGEACFPLRLINQSPMTLRISSLSKLLRLVNVEKNRAGSSRSCGGGVVLTLSLSLP